MSRIPAILLCLAASAWPAFSAAQGPGTTTPSPADDIDPATGLARSTVVRPLQDVATPPAPGVRAVPAATAEPIAPGDARLAPPGKPHIALILPVASPSLGRVADAVRQGFAAGATAGGKNALPVVLLNVENDGSALLEACRRAQQQGAVLVVAGLTRDGATALARSDCPRIPVLTLNQPADAELP